MRFSKVAQATHLTVIAVLALGLVGFATAGPIPSDDGPGRPNIVVILADDLGFSDLGSYGSEIETPHLDRLASRGLRFSQFYVTPRCSPTRASLLTGLYSHEVGIGRLNERWGRPGYRGELSAEATTLAEALRAAGYRTYISGKWHLAHNPTLDGTQPDAAARRAWPRERGFDRFFGTIRGSGSFYQPSSLVLDDRFIETPKDFFYTDATGSAAIEFLNDHFATTPSDPFFLYLSYTAPHWPLHAPKDDVRKVQGRYDAGWDALRKERHRRMVELEVVRDDWPLATRDPRAEDWADTDHKEWQLRRMEVYAAMVEGMDTSIGQVVSMLEGANVLDNTLIVFLSDNGGNGEQFRGITKAAAWFMPVPEIARRDFGDDPKILPGPAASFQTCGPGWSSLQNTPFRLGKHATHEGGIASPLIVHWPAGIDAPPGTWVRSPSHVVDLMPTFLEVAGAPSTAGLRGESLMPLLRGDTKDRGPMFWEHEGNRAVRDGRWKLVSEWPGGWELYDLEIDRTELRNLAAEYPERVAIMAAMYERFAAETGVETWPWVSRLYRSLIIGGLLFLLLVSGAWLWHRRCRAVDL